MTATTGQVIHGIECYEAWRNYEDCPHEREELAMSAEYAPFDQAKHLGPPPWRDERAVAAWEYAHGHDCRTKCYPEFGCRAIEMERDRLLDRVEELEAACSKLTTENLRLDAQRAELARELLTAAQHERSRLATADHRRDLAGRWLDLARSVLPAPPTAAEMEGIFATDEKDDDLCQRSTRQET